MYPAAEAIVAGHPLRQRKTARGVVSYRESGEGREIVLLHGIGNQSASWSWQLAELAPRFRVIAWDAPGYGASDSLDKPAPTARDYADSLEALLDALDVASALMVGSSLGALVAGAFAARHPERVSGLVLLNPAAGYGLAAAVEREAKLAARLERLAQLGPEGMARDLPAGMLSPAALDDARALAQWSTATIRPDGYAQAARMLASGRLVEDAPRYPGPVLVIAGTHDSVTPAAGCERIAGAFPRGTFRLLAGVGHLSYLDTPPIVSGLIADFAERCMESLTA